MNTKLTNLQVTDFLQDYEARAELVLLEEGSAKKELIDIAEAKNINLKKNSDLVGFKCIYAFADKANANGAYLPEKDLLQALPSMIGKPVNIGHSRRFVIGHLLDYRYKKSSKQVIAYGVFYRSCFGDEYKQAKKDFKAKKLNVSFEIWSPKDKRKKRADGSEELHQMEIAGMAILFRDEEPAFDGARVLEFSNKLQKDSPELVYASKYKEEEMLFCTSKECKLEKSADNAGTIEVKLIPKNKKVEQVTKVETIEPKPEIKTEKPIPQISKIKCSNCGEEFENGLIDKIKCPKCFAILNSTGQMIYPPQIKDFRLLCPSCKVNNWLILSKKEDNAKVRCMSCAKEYSLIFATQKRKAISEDFQFLYTGSATCIQCGRTAYVSGISSIKEREVTCKYCGLTFSYNISHDKYKKIIKILDLSSNPIDKKIETSEKGGKTMAESKKEIKKDEVKTKEEVKPKAEKKVEEPKKAEVKPKVETKSKVETKETPKAEKVEVKKAEKKVEVKPTKPAVKELPKEVKAEKIVKPAKYPKTKTLRKAVKKLRDIEKGFEVDNTKLRQVVRKAVGRVLDVKKASKETLTTSKTAKDTLTAGIRKLAKQVIELRKQVGLYEASAVEIVTRRNELDGFGKELSNEDILNDDKFAKAKLEKENALLKASVESDENEIVGSKKKDGDWYAKRRKAINKQAFTKPKK